MNYNKIRKMDIADGEGIRVSIFFQGCDFLRFVKMCIDKSGKLC